MIVSAQLQKVLPLDVYDPQMLTQEDKVVQSSSLWLKAKHSKAEGVSY